MSAAGDVYFAVGFNENFADKCLYTMATATGAVSQFSEVGSGPQGPISIVTLGEGSVNDLDEATKDWNASLASDGTLTLN